MESEEFRTLLVKMVKASGQEVIERAEDLVGNGDFIRDFDIYLRFPIDGQKIIGIPKIEVTRSHSSKNCVVAIMGSDLKG